MVTFRMFVVQDDAIDQVRYANSSLEGSKVDARSLLAVFGFGLLTNDSAEAGKYGVAEVLQSGVHR